MTLTPTPASASASSPYDPNQFQQRDGVYIAGNVLGIASMVFGTLGVLVSLIPVIGVIAVPLCVMGILWGGIGALVLHLGKRGSIRFPLIGLGLCGVALLLVVVINVVVLGGLAATA